MPLIQGSAAQSTEGISGKPSQQGISVFPSGPFYIQFGPTTAIASSTTETTILNPTFTGTTPTALGSLVIPANGLTQGLTINAEFHGTIANTSTPNLTMTVGGKNAAGTYTAWFTTGAVAMSNVSTTEFETGFQFTVKTVGSSGVLVGNIYDIAGTTGVSATTAASSAIDLTQQWTLDMRLTWGTNSASNTATVLYGFIEVIG